MCASPAAGPVLVGEDPFGKVVAALERAGHRCKVTPRGVRARCPIHSDLRPSLSVGRGDDGRALLYCHAGCDPPDIVRSLGLTMRDLFPEGPRSPSGPRIETAYDYCDHSGVVLAQKVRYSPKGFSWRRPDPEDQTRWIPNLNGIEVGLYRLPDLVDERRVFLVEGEKAVERLRGEQLVATCPPAGASSWHRAWSMDLWRSGCRELIVLPDADTAGRVHAERVAEAIWYLEVLKCDCIRVKVVALPGLCGGADAFDWFEEGGTREGLLQIVSEGPQWVPGGAERERCERKRARGRERSRRFRARQLARRADDSAA